MSERVPMHMEVQIGRKHNRWLGEPDSSEYESAAEIIKRQIRAELGWDVWTNLVYPEETE